MSDAFVRSFTLAAALQDAGFTRRVAVVALFELLVGDAVKIRKSKEGWVLAPGASTPQSEVLAKLKIFLFSHAQEISLSPYAFPIRRAMLAGRQFLLRGPEGSFFLPFPGKHKFWLAFIPIGFFVAAGVSQMIASGVTSVVMSIGLFVLAILSFVFIRRSPDRVPASSRELRASLQEQWRNSAGGEVVFWREVLTGRFTEASARCVPESLQRVLRETGLSQEELRALLWRALLPEYRRSVVGT